MKYMRGRPSVWVLIGIILLAQGFFSRPAFTQGEPQLRGPELLQEIQHDISPPLRDINPPLRPVGPPEAKEIRLLHPPREVKRMPDSVMQTSTLANISTTAGVNFEGVAANGSAPPDTNGSAGMTQFVEWVNTEFAVYDKTGKLLLGPVAGNTLWSGFGGPCETNNDGDIIVLYDKLNNRWVMSQLSVTFGPPFYQCVAVSTTSDATGSFARYAFAQPGFNDYPKLGVWPDAYYISYNLFNNTGTAFLGARLCAMDGAAMRAGSAATQQCFQLGTNFGAVLPSDVDGTTPPPAGEPAFFLGFDNNLGSLDLWKFHVNFTTPANSTLTGPTTLAISPFNEACGGGTCVPQSGTTQQLDSLADRVMYRLAYRNFGSHESLVVNHSITAGSSVGARWYEIQNPAANPVVFQSGTFAPDSSYRWMGSIAMDKAGNIALGYSVSSSSLHPAIRYTGRVPSDPLGTMETETSIIEGPGSQTGGLTRWGDYSSMSVDPVDDCTFWYSSEYQPSNGAFNWHTRIASFKFPGCGGPDFSTSASPSSQTVVAGNSTPYTVNVGSLNGFSGTVTFSASGLPSGAGASFNPTSVTGSGSSTMTVTTSTSTPAGTYTIMITGASGSLSHATTVSLTVNAAAQPNFSLSASPSSVTVTQGNSGTSTITVTPQNSFSGTVTFGVTSDLPSGAGASFSPTSVTGSGSSTMTVTTLTSTPAGTYPITITGTSGSLSHTTTVSLTVNAAAQPNFSLSRSPSSVTITQGTSGTSTITVTPQNGFTGSVSLATSVLPNGVTASFNPASTTSTSMLTLTASSSATTGSVTVTITGTSGGLTHTTTIALTVNPGPNFSLSASPNSLNVARGSTGTSTITISPMRGFTGSVSFSASNLPTGVTATFSPNSSTSASTLTLTVGSSATTGTFSVRVRGRSGTLSHSIRISLTVL